MKCNRCGEEMDPNNTVEDVRNPTHMGCKGDAAWKAAKECLKECIDPDSRTQETIARHMREYGKKERADEEARELEARKENDKWVDALETAARALLEKLKEVKPHVDNACVIAALHGIPYSGPTRESEFNNLVAVLEKGKSCPTTPKPKT